MGRTQDRTGAGAARPWRVGELAAATGLTVRTLHYYDELGLLGAARTSGGHRQYDASAIETLYQIQLGRALDLSLADIAEALARGPLDTAALTHQKIASLDEEIARSQRLRAHLTATSDDLSHPQAPDARELLENLKELAMHTTAVRRRIPTLVYADVAAAHDYLVRVFGFESGQIDRDDAGSAIHAEVTAGDGVIWLHRVAPEFGLQSPRALHAETAGISVIVDDVDAHHARAVEQRATIRYEPTDQPYGYREYAAVDPEDHLWAFMAPLS